MWNIIPSGHASKHTYFNVGANNHAQQASVSNVCYRTVFPTNETVFTSIHEKSTIISVRNSSWSRNFQDALYQSQFCQLFSQTCYRGMMWGMESIALQCQYPQLLLLNSKEVIKQLNVYSFSPIVSLSHSCHNHRFSLKQANKEMGGN